MYDELSGFYNMDCMEGMKQIPDKYFDLAIVDPPYGIDINSSGRVGHYGGKGKSGIPNRRMKNTSRNYLG